MKNRTPIDAAPNRERTYIAAYFNDAGEVVISAEQNASRGEREDDFPNLIHFPSYHLPILLKWLHELHGELKA